MRTIPAVSVIIPLYNAERYIGQCLDSLLAQTFTDFEVIVVDDCSTDNSVAVVESYIPKFNGRLKLEKTLSNSGYASLPRNKGMELSRGEYLYFFDPDDTITPTALDELYTAAKKFNADVVHCEKYYLIPDKFYHDANYRKNLKPYSWPMTDKIFITKPTLLTNDIEKRVMSFSKKWLQWAVWMQLIRRDFVIDNGIRFVNAYSQDLIFTMCEICCAKNYIVLPNVFYFWRFHEGSKVTEKLDVSKDIHKYVAVLEHGINYLDEFLNRRAFFAERTDLKYVLFGTIATTILGRLDKIYSQHSVYIFDEFLRKEFFDCSPAVAAFFFSTMNVYRLQLSNAQKQAQKFNQFAAAAQQRIAELETEVNQLKAKEAILWPKTQNQPRVNKESIPPPDYRIRRSRLSFRCTTRASISLNVWTAYLPRRFRTSRSSLLMIAPPITALRSSRVISRNLTGGSSSSKPKLITATPAFPEISV